MQQNLLAITLLVLCMGGCEAQKQSSMAKDAQTTQLLIDQIADTLEVSYEVLENRGGGHCLPEINQPCYRAKISFTSPHAFAAQDFEVYFSSVDRINQVIDGEFKIEHVNGDLNRITPSATFTAFQAGERKNVEFIVNGLNLTEARMMPNYYVVSEHTQARTIRSTRTKTDPESGLEIRPYARDLDWETGFIRAQGDNTQLADAEYLFVQNQDTKLDKSQLDISIIPTPAFVSQPTVGAKLDLTNGMRMVDSDFDQKDIDFALSTLRLMGIAVTENPQATALTITRNPSSKSQKGHYELNVSAKGINILANDPVGASHGLISLISLLMPDSKTIPIVKVVDQPRFEFRGLHIDVSRNFHSKQLILDLLDQMALYKLNKLHLHLGDDEGWRLEIEDLPELTDIGSKRCHDPKENSCLLPQLGSGADSPAHRDGYYSKQDYLQILEAASLRHIQVIPSFDMPGHSRAAVKAMEARYKKYMAKNEPDKATRYLLSDLNDTTEYRSIQHYNDNTINVCMPSSYRFIEKVIDEIVVLHKKAQHPLTRYHIGADETAGAWKDSPLCQALFNDPELEISDPHDLSGYFIERIAALLDDKGIEPAGWSDGMSNERIQSMPDIVQTNLWGTIYDQGHKAAHKQVNKGWQAVLSTPDALYYDFPYESHPKEAGYNWASRHTNTRKVFEFMPGNLPVHAEFWRDNQDRSYQTDDRLSTHKDGRINHQPMKNGLNYIGIQGHLWSETIRTDDQVEYQLFPRLLALAERAWHAPDWEVPYNNDGAVYNSETGTFTDSMRVRRDKQWNVFANAIANKALLKLDRANIFYRIPTVGAKIEDQMLYANLIFPGLVIEFRSDKGNWKTYQGPTKVSGRIEVRARSADGKRAGRSLWLEP